MRSETDTARKCREEINYMGENIRSDAFLETYLREEKITTMELVV